MDIPREFVEAMIKHALEDDPNECCGIFASKAGKIVKQYAMTNTEHSPFRYSMDSKELFNTYMEIEDERWELAVIYHSHTHSPAYPSATDVRLATWPEAYYILISLMNKESPDLKAYTIVDGVIQEEKINIAE